MHIQPMRRSSLFLLELILAILFFSLTAAVCVRIFVKSHMIEAENNDLNHAVSAATSVAEIFYSQDEPINFLEEQFPDGASSENAFQIFYDDSWELCTKADAAYVLSLELEHSDSLLLGDIQVEDSESSIYTLDLKKHITEEVLSE